MEVAGAVVRDVVRSFFYLFYDGYPAILMDQLVTSNKKMTTDDLVSLTAFSARQVESTLSALERENFVVRESQTNEDRRSRNIIQTWWIDYQQTLNWILWKYMELERGLTRVEENSKQTEKGISRKCGRESCGRKFTLVEFSAAMDHLGVFTCPECLGNEYLRIGREEEEKVRNMRIAYDSIKDYIQRCAAQLAVVVVNSRYPWDTNWVVDKDMLQSIRSHANYFDSKFGRFGGSRQGQGGSSGASSANRLLSANDLRLEVTKVNVEERSSVSRAAIPWLAHGSQSHHRTTTALDGVAPSSTDSGMVSGVSSSLQTSKNVGLPASLVLEALENRDGLDSGELARKRQKFEASSADPSVVLEYMEKMSSRVTFPNPSPSSSSNRMEVDSKQFPASITSGTGLEDFDDDFEEVDL